jgi:hypothetical protein
MAEAKQVPFGPNAAIGIPHKGNADPGATPDLDGGVGVTQLGVPGALLEISAVVVARD